MRDSHRKKRRDIRKATRSWQGFTAYDLYEKLHPEPPYFAEDGIWRGNAWRGYKNPEWDRWHNEKDRWVRENFGITYETCGAGPIPADFRQEQNRLLRTREKAALRRAVQTGDFDGLVMPRFRRNIRWLYW